LRFEKQKIETCLVPHFTLAPLGLATKGEKQNVGIPTFKINGSLLFIKH